MQPTAAISLLQPLHPLPCPISLLLVPSTLPTPPTSPVDLPALVGSGKVKGTCKKAPVFLPASQQYATEHAARVPYGTLAAVSVGGTLVPPELKPNRIEI